MGAIHGQSLRRMLTRCHVHLLVFALRNGFEAETALAEAENELPGLRAQLEHAESSLRQMEQEKLDLQYQATNMEAEIQRAKSLQRFLESQVVDGYVSGICYVYD